MDHSYSSGKDCSEERERLSRLDHCYFAITNKAPMVIQRKTQQRLENDQWWTSRLNHGRDDHTYGRRVLAAGKENSAADYPLDAPCTGVAVKSPLSAGNPDHEYFHKTRLSPSDAACCKDHTYSDRTSDKQCKKKPSDRLRYDHVYCTAAEGDAGPLASAQPIEQAQMESNSSLQSAQVKLRDCGCPMSNSSRWTAMARVHQLRSSCGLALGASAVSSCPSSVSADHT